MAIAEVISRYEGYIAYAASELAYDQGPLTADLEQEARILLWKMGAKKAAAMDEAMVKVAIVWRMIDVWREQWSREGGDRKVVVHLQVA